jgi:DNA-binding beta-propeller fold protein YncE
MYRGLSGLVAMVLATASAWASSPTTESFAIVHRIPGPDGNWDYAIADAAGRRLYVARDYGVMSVDLDSGAVVPRLVPGRGVHGIASVGATGRFVSTNGDSGTVTIFEGRTGRVIGTVKAGKEPDSVVFDPKSGLVIAFNHEGGDATLVDPTALRVVGAIPVGGTLEFGAVDGEGHAYVNVASKNQIAIIDVAARRVTSTIPLQGCEEPSGLAYDARDRLLISVCFNGAAEFVDPTAHGPIATVRTGKFPDAVIWDPDRYLAFVPSFADGTLTVIAVRGRTAIRAVQTLPTQVGTRTGALDSTTGNIYLPTSKLNPPLKEGAYPTPVAGTFEILVVNTLKDAAH